MRYPPGAQINVRPPGMTQTPQAGTGTGMSHAVGPALPVVPSPFGDNGTTWSPVRPAHLANLGTAIVPQGNRKHASISFGGTPPPGGSFAFSFDWGNVTGPIQRRTYEADVANDVWSLNQVYEINISSFHPWHLHIYEMLVGCS